MTPKNIIVGLLLVFVVVSVGYLIVQEVRTGESVAAEGDKPAAVNEKVVAYYFYGTNRCRKCILFEKYTDELINKKYAKEMKSGVFEWKRVNVEKQENRHFIRDYDLFTKSLVLVKIKDGKQAEWKNLKKIWELVGDKAAYDKYVGEEIDSYLGNS